MGYEGGLSMDIYGYNTSGQRYRIYEQRLEPPDCFEPEPEPASKCSKCGQDIWPGEYAFGDGTETGKNLCPDCFKELLAEQIKHHLSETAELLGYDVILN